MKHPIQPMVMDGKILRFKKNEIVRYLLDNGGIDLNKLALMDFSRNDREQFAQLIGYSICGFCELSYVTPSTYKEVERLEAIALENKGKKS